MHALNKILIIRFSSLGDAILATPLIRVLRTSFPATRIDFLTKSEYVEVLKFNPHLSSIIHLTTGDSAELKALRRRVRAERYDAIIDIHNSLRSRYVRMFSGAKYVRVVNKRIVRRFLLVHFKWNWYGAVVSVADRYLETVRKFSVHDDGHGLEVFVPDEIKATVDAMLSKYRLDRFNRVFGLVPTAKHFTKCWLPERFVELGATLAKSHRAKIFVFGSREDVDYCGDIAQMINMDAGSTVAESLAGKLSLLETAAVLDACDVVVSNDSGIMHLAAARKRPVVAIFGSTVREFGFFPYGTESLVIERRGLLCRPCSHIGREKCPRVHFMCMKEIEAGEVLAAVQSLFVTRTEEAK